MIFILVFEDFEMKRSILTYHALLLSGKHCTIGKPLRVLIPICSQARRFEQHDRMADIGFG